jgi:hypothetical protein
MVWEALASVASLIVLFPVSPDAQGPPDFSGDWVLVKATTLGGRPSGKAVAPTTSDETSTSSNTLSGAAFNCGRGCTIHHKGQTLTVEAALLGSDVKPAPSVTLQLDGRRMSVIDSFSPKRQLPVTAKWNGAKLEITTSPGPYTVTQSLGVDAAQLVVVTSVDRPSERPVTLRYAKK